MLRGGSWTTPPGLCRSAYRLAVLCPVGRTASWVSAWPSSDSAETARTPSPKPLSEGTKPGQEWSGNGPAMKFCWCPPGEFKMGEAADQVDVKLTRGFWLGKYEVTQAEYRAVMKENPSHFSPTGAGQALRRAGSRQVPGGVVSSWDEATEFCRVLTDQERA